MLGRLALLSIAAGLSVSSSIPAQQVRRVGGENPRVSTRIAYFGQNTSEGQLAIDFGQPEWKAEYDTRFDELTQGKRWRLGDNFWTSLDTQLDLSIAGTPVPAGYYYLVLERSESDDWYLVLLNPKEIQGKKLDAFQAEQTTGGIRVTLVWDQTEDIVAKLTIRLTSVPDKLEKATLTIEWGKHKLTAPIDVSL